MLRAKQEGPEHLLICYWLCEKVTGSIYAVHTVQQKQAPVQLSLSLSVTILPLNEVRTLLVEQDLQIWFPGLEMLWTVYSCLLFTEDAMLFLLSGTLCCLSYLMNKSEYCGYKSGFSLFLWASSCMPFSLSFSFFPLDVNTMKAEIFVF